MFRPWSRSLFRSALLAPTTDQSESLAGVFGLDVADVQERTRERREKQERQTRKGSRWLRSALTEAAQAAGRTKDTFRRSNNRLIARRGKKKTVVAVGHSVLEITYQVLKDRADREDVALGARVIQATGIGALLLLLGQPPRLVVGVLVVVEGPADGQGAGRIEALNGAVVVGGADLDLVGTLGGERLEAEAEGQGDGGGKRSKC